MSGSGGYYRYRCKYFLTHNCPNWVYVNNTACATCSSQGRDVEPASSQVPVMGYPYEICVPRVEAGVLYYTLVAIEVVPTDGAGNYGTIRYNTNNQSQPQIPTTTTALPGTPITTTSF
ncbi:hypothetical protein F4861DRAFT_536592 [Xylaria intraflava]|nr:hypothetical protein F4861DRAFT_536592 [Xylaria intraflava]